MRTNRSAAWIAALVFILSSLQPVAGQLPYRSGKDVPTCLAPVSKASEVLAGYSSGRVVRLTPERSKTLSGPHHRQPRATWEARVDGAVLSMLTLPRAGTSAEDVIVATATGKVVRFDDGATRPSWEFASTCEVSSLVAVADVDGDGQIDIGAGGTDHRAHLLSGKTGKPLWSRMFETRMGGGYVSRMLAMPDVNADGTPDLAVYLWSGELTVLSGRSGEQIWRQRVGMGFTDALALSPDPAGGAVPALLVGGNDHTVRLCSGRDGSVIWSGRVERPIRDIVVARATPAQTDGIVAYVCTAGGELACFSVKAGAPDRPIWTAYMEDVCRGAAVVDDLDSDGVADVAGYSEKGGVSVFSGASGSEIGKHHAVDVVRAICPLHLDSPAKGVSHLAVATLDGEVSFIALPLIRGATPKSAQPVSKPAHHDYVWYPTSGPVRAVMTRQPTRPARKFPQTQEPERVLILLYHDIVPEVFYRYGTSVANFRAQMDALASEKYTCVSLDEIANWLEGKGGLPARAVCITFDGPYQGHYTYAYPMLRERGLFATSYITTDWIGTSNHADWHQLREMDAAGIMDIQNHTTNHAELAHVSIEEAADQLNGCNLAILQHMGKISRHHAYPSGWYSPQVCQLLRGLGFRTATTVRGRGVTRGTDLMLLPRYTLVNDTPIEQFRGWLIRDDVRPIGAR